MVRKDVLANEGGFNPTLTHGVDWELFARLASKYPIHCIPQCLGKQRLHAGQVTKNFRSKADSYYLFHARILELWREDPVRRRILIQDSARVYADLGKHFFQIGDYQYARRCFGRSLSIGPLSLKNWRRLGISFVPGLRSWYRLNTARRTTFGD
jgi:tetratricopeptide (TPR) repeat protein